MWSVLKRASRAPRSSTSLAAAQVRLPAHDPIARFLPALASPANDPEREADRTAAVVTAGPGLAARSATDTGPGVVPGPLAGLLGGSGRPLPAQERDYFETRFGHDFGRVRVHTDARAARSAEALNARAYTSGNDVVFGPGQYSPESGEGRRLLAHELTHVVQQARGAAPLIQRQLKVTGAKADIKAMLTLLGTASGLTLTHDPKTRLVSWAAAKTKAKTISPELAATLKTIIDDPKKDAELNLGRKQEGVSFGQFPPDLTNPVQEIRIDQMLALEKGAPGAGAAKLGHEISENYTGHGLATYDWGTAFELSHMEGLRVENAVEKELGHPGERRNTFKVLSKKGKKNILTEIEDRSQYFLVFEQDFDAGTGAVLNPRRVPRLKVAAHTIDGFSAGSTDIPKGQEKNLQALADDMKKNPTASALAEGFASAARTGADNENLARKWAELVQDKTIKAVGDVINTSWRRFTLQGSFAKGRNQVVVTLERPDL